MEAIAWVGGILLAVCGLPQAIACYRQKHAQGIDIWFLFAWYIGEILLAFYSWDKIDNLALFFNYFANVIMITVIMYYKIWPKNISDKHTIGVQE